MSAWAYSIDAEAELTKILNHEIMKAQAKELKAIYDKMIEDENKKI